jgi:hypothetical protein
MVCECLNASAFDAKLWFVKYLRWFNNARRKKYVLGLLGLS